MLADNVPVATSPRLSSRCGRWLFLIANGFRTELGCTSRASPPLRSLEHVVGMLPALFCRGRRLSVGVLPNDHTLSMAKSSEAYSFCLQRGCQREFWSGGLSWCRGFGVFTVRSPETKCGECGRSIRFGGGAHRCGGHAAEVMVKPLAGKDYEDRTLESDGSSFGRNWLAGNVNTSMTSSSRWLAYSQQCPRPTSRMD